MIYWQLFRTFMIIGVCCFGGGYAALPFIQGWVVDRYAWLGMEQFIDVVTISQMTPGPIGINAATFVGTQLAGLPGAIAATLGFICPSVVIVLALSRFYFKYRSLELVGGVLTGLKPAVAALIFASTVTIVRSALWETGVLTEPNLAALCIAAAGFLALRRAKAGPMTVIFGSGVAGLLVYGLLGVK
ncbi:MAG: chromate transporter [Clostridia bacterium]|nr:chromate transporter [Clostridia bacterium]